MCRCVNDSPPLITHHSKLITQNKMKKMQKNFSITALLVCVSTLLVAQNNKLDSTTVITVEAYQPFLNDAFKIKNNPTIKDTSKIIPTLNYTFINKQLPVAFKIDTIKPAKIVGEPLKKLYRGYAKLGFGTNTTPLFEAYYNSNRSKEYNWGIDVKHLSSEGVSGIGNSNFSDNHIGVFGKKFTKQFTLQSKLGYDRNVVNYYGIPNNLAKQTFASEGIEDQRFNKFSVGLGLNRNFTDTNQFDYHTNITYHHIGDLFDVSENNFQLDGKLEKYHKKELYEIGAIVSYNNISNLLNLSNTIAVGLLPQISTQTKKWKFNLGAGIFINSQEFSEKETDFHFYPKAEFKYNVVDDILIPYIGIRGGLINNNLGTFYQDNPFINTNALAPLNSNQKYDIYAGVRGSISNKITFKTSFSKQKIDNQPLYVKEFNTILQNKFAVIYDEIDFINLNAEVTYQQLEKLKFLLITDYYSYNADKELEVWHKPNYKITLSGIYDLEDKIIARVDFFILGKQYAKETTTLTTTEGSITTASARKLDGIFDANLGFEYRYTKKLSAFLNFNNLFAVRYQRFQDYPTQRFNIMGGLTYSF